MGSVSVSRELFEKGGNSWWVIYRGKKDLQSPSHLEKRPYCKSQFYSDPRQWLESLGCKLQFEYIRKGYAALWKNTNLVAELFQILSSSYEPVAEDSILVIYTFVEGGKDWSHLSQLFQNIVEEISPFVSFK